MVVKELLDIILDEFPVIKPYVKSILPFIEHGDIEKKIERVLNRYFGREIRNIIGLNELWNIRMGLMGDRLKDEDKDKLCKLLDYLIATVIVSHSK